MIVELPNHQGAFGSRVGRACGSNGFRLDGLMGFGGATREKKNERSKRQTDERLICFHKHLSYPDFQISCSFTPVAKLRQDFIFAEGQRIEA
jgi:hypothetical protein